MYCTLLIFTFICTLFPVAITVPKTITPALWAAGQLCISC